MVKSNSEKPFRMPEDERADEVLRKMPPAFTPTPLDQQERYVERMIRLDREAEQMKDPER